MLLGFTLGCVSQRKFDHLESKYLTIKEEQQDIEYQFDKLKAATVIAKRDLREEELTYEALLVATQMESAKLNTRAKAFRRVASCVELLHCARV